MHRLAKFIIASILLPLLLASLMAANLLQMLSLAVAPFSPILFRKINRALCGAWFYQLRWVLEVALRVEIRQTGDEIPWRENAFLIPNHQAMADIPALIAVAHRAGRQGDLKWFVKDPLKWVPGIGWGMLFLDCLFVKRNWTTDKEKVQGTFARIREHASPFWIVSFLEGTRKTPAKLARSQAFGMRQGLPELKHVMLPRTKGFEATLAGLGDRMRAIYIATIAYEEPPPSLLGLFFGPTKRIHVHMRRFADLPETDRAAWVIERFQESDRLLEAFEQKGHF